MTGTLPAFRILPASELSDARLLAFYQKFFPRDCPLFAQHHRWWHGDYVGYVPQVALNEEGEIVGFVGGTPLRFHDHGRCLRAGTLTDLFVDPRCRGHRLGQRLLRGMIDQVDVSIGAGANLSSRAILEAMGMRFTDNVKSFLFILSLRRLDHLSPKAALLRPVLVMLAPLYERFLWHRSLPGLGVAPLRDQRAALEYLIRDDREFGPCHDSAWIQWRFWKSPFIDQYWIAKHNTAQGILRFIDGQNLRRLHILYLTPDAQPRDLVLFLRQVFRWAIEHRADMAYAIASTPALKTLYRRFASRTSPMHNGVMFADGRHRDARLAERALALQLMDTDFDLVYLG